MENLSASFGSHIFSDKVMREKLPKEIYIAMKHCARDGSPLEPSVANVVASTMKEWALELGATHYCHWFQPLTGITAEKHDSFLCPDGKGGAISEFSGKELIMGEPDASSFPSGGLRATFEARGYTAWDPTSWAFVKDDTLYVPTVFFSHNSDALDKKTPLLRSIQAINNSALRILKLFGDTQTKAVIPTVGAEQEYFLVDKEDYQARRDLRFCNRTLFGALPPKGQEMDDHYFGAISPRVKAFMADLDEACWKLGIPSKTEHNEAAPAQHEMAPVFSRVNLACDQNQLLMSLMQKIAGEHGFVCLLQEKPFAGVNGSGKHNNWSLSTDRGTNLLDPGATPYENLQFLLFLCAVLTAVDEHADLLRISVASAGNDHRLGGSEAPPAIVSMFLGDELTEVLKSFETDVDYLTKSRSTLDAGVTSLPRIFRDTTDRNRTSPFAFTGNKFEFRMPGASQSVADPNIMLNTIVSDVLDRFADELEQAQDFDEAVHRIVKQAVTEHKRIIFNGDGYTDEWVQEAFMRGLPNYPTTVDCTPHLLRSDNLELFARHGVYTKSELQARHDIILENYSKTIAIEAKTMLEMARKEILPAVAAYMDRTAKAILHTQKVLNSTCTAQTELLQRLDAAYAGISRCVTELQRQLDEEVVRSKDVYEVARIYRDGVLPVMDELRAEADAVEALLPTEYLSYPTYDRLLFGVDQQS